MTVKHIIDEVKKLSPTERAELMDALLVLEPDDSDVALTPAQSEDLRRRIEEVRSGRVEFMDVDEAFEQIRKQT